MMFYCCVLIAVVCWVGWVAGVAVDWRHCWRCDVSRDCSQRIGCEMWKTW